MQMMILVLAVVKIASYGAKVNHVNIYNGIVRMGNVVIIEAHCTCQLRVVEEFVSSKLLSCSISSTARPLHGGEADLGGWSSRRRHRTGKAHLDGDDGTNRHTLDRRTLGGPPGSQGSS